MGVFYLCYNSKGVLLYAPYRVVMTVVKKYTVALFLYGRKDDLLSGASFVTATPLLPNDERLNTGLRLSHNALWARAGVYRNGSQSSGQSPAGNYGGLQ